ncbi:hypothetical protein RJ641_014798 [Dillenia turbinata]|uniref:Uncharacterized protein n=1 Tax=Dillenia turbinata TaxID=194707 RepID=A0AAN8Z2X3_9MAGN
MSSAHQFEDPKAYRRQLWWTFYGEGFPGEKPKKIEESREIACGFVTGDEVEVRDVDGEGAESLRAGEVSGSKGEEQKRHVVQFQHENLGPKPRSKKKGKRKKGIEAAKQGGSPGFEMCGQKSSSGPQVRNL